MRPLRQRKRVLLEGGGSTQYPWYSPKFWHGMGAITWFRLVAENRATVSPSRLRIMLTVSILSGFNSCGRLLTDWTYRRKLNTTELPVNPIFIIGHWRSGTTLLHELMMLDVRFATPNTYQCFAPGHFLLTEPFFHRYGRWLLPDKRPIDNVKAGWDRPQEDEFALMNLGAPSPYTRIAFPLNAPARPFALDINKLQPKEINRWKKALRKFMIRLTIKDNRRPVLKSPTHTARIGILLEMFPQASFIYITRNPYDIYPSTKRLWQALHHTQSLQDKQDQRLDSYILNCFDEIQNAFKRDKQRIPEKQFFEIKYEELISDPIESMKRIYEKLELGDFAPMQKALEKESFSLRNYRTNTYKLSKETQALISREWKEYLIDNGYKLEISLSTSQP